MLFFWDATARTEIGGDSALDKGVAADKRPATPMSGSAGGDGRTSILRQPGVQDHDPSSMQAPLGHLRTAGVGGQTRGRTKRPVMLAKFLTQSIGGPLPNNHLLSTYPPAQRHETVHLAPTGGSSSIMQAFSSMFVHFPLVPA
jgi:hypothetical protein